MREEPIFLNNMNNDKPTKPLCKICDSPYHYQSFCPQKPKKPIAVNKPLKRTPLKRTGFESTTVRKLPKPKVDTERQKAIKKADTAFSQYIRARDIIFNGYFRCCSCNALKPFREMDCGHYIPRRFLAVRWDENNAHGECITCNRVDDKHMVGYKQFMLKKYGEQKVSYLRQKANLGGYYSVQDIQDIAEKYKNKFKEIKKDLRQK